MLLLHSQPLLANTVEEDKKTIESYQTDKQTNDITNLLMLGHSKLGSPYKWGGSGPSAFDCSGFTQYIYKHVGIKLPHNAALQFNHGVFISKQKLQPGDLVFFGYYGSRKIGHVGIFTGNNSFIHASSGGVKYSSLGNRYYLNNYKGAKRLIN
ncbi:MAG: NlpC/P60 family protein [Firmicutes bacterium]|nr:NlpC/P60 family protein [Bacillota bacterium]